MPESQIYVIEKNVPLPPRRGGGSNGGTIPLLRRMEAGDSFFAKGKKHRNFWSIAKSLGMKIATRREGDGVRVWCLEPAKPAGAST